MTTTNPTEFLVKTTITVTYRNPAGIEEKKSLDAVLPLDAKGVEKPTFVLVNYLVPAYLRQTLGTPGTAWNRVYEIKIHKIVNRREPKDINLIPVRHLTLDQLQAYCKKWELPVKPEEFHSIEYARQMVILYQEDPKGYEVQYAQYLGGENRLFPELDALRKDAANLKFDASLTKEFESLDTPQAISPNLVPDARETDVVEATPSKTRGRKPRPVSDEIQATVENNDPFSQM